MGTVTTIIIIMDLLLHTKMEQLMVVDLNNKCRHRKSNKMDMVINNLIISNKTITMAITITINMVAEEEVHLNLAKKDHLLYRCRITLTMMEISLPMTSICEKLSLSSDSKIISVEIINYLSPLYQFTHRFLS